MWASTCASSRTSRKTPAIRFSPSSTCPPGNSQPLRGVRTELHVVAFRDERSSRDDVSGVIHLVSYQIGYREFHGCTIITTANGLQVRKQLSSQLSGATG